MAADGSIIIDTRIDNSGAAKDLQEFERKVGAAAKASVVAMGALSAAVIKVGSDFESSVAKASTLFGGVKVDTAGLNDQILELSSSSGVAASAIGNSLYNALSAGIPVTKDMGSAMKYMEQSTKLAKAGFTDVDTVVTSTAKVLNAYKMDVSETDKVHKVLMQTQNKGITTVGELGASLAQVTPTASAMNVAFEQVGASLATMTAQGTPTAQATTQLNQLFAELGKKGTAAQKGLAEATKGTKYAGKSFQDLMAAGVPMNEVLDLMDTYAKKNNKSLLDMFGSIEAGKAALAMSGQNAKQFSDNLAAMGTNADVVEDAYTKVTDTLQEQTKQAVETTKNLGIKIYKNMEGPLKDIVKEANEGMKKVAKALDTPAAKAAIKGLVDGFASIVKAVGNVVVNVGGPLLKALGALAKDGKKAADVVRFGTSMFLAYKTAVSVAKGIQLAYTAQVKLAEAAQRAFNFAMTANPATLLAVAIGAVATGLGFMLASTEKQTTATDELNEKLTAQREAMQDLEKQREEKLDSDLAELDNTKALLAELQGLTDEQGNIIGSKERAKAIIDQINKVLPDTVELVNDEKVAYKQTAEELHKLILQKQAQATLDAMYPEYQEAIATMNDKLAAQEKAKIELENQRAVVAKARAEFERDASAANGAYLDEEVAKLEKSESAYNEATRQVQECLQKKNGYLAASTDIASENEKKMRLAVLLGPDAYYSANGDIKEALRQRLETEKTYYNGLMDQVNKGMLDVNDSTVTTVKQNIADLEAAIADETSIQSPEVRQSGEKLGQSYIDGQNSAVPGAAGSGKKLADSSTDALISRINASSSYVQDGGRKIAQDAASGIESGTYNVVEAQNNLVEAAREGGVRKVESSDWEYIGFYMASGIAAGIKNGIDEPKVAISSAINSVYAEARKRGIIRSPSKLMAKGVGEPLAQGIGAGIEGEKEEVARKSRDAVLAAYNAMRSTVIGETMRIGMTMSGTYNINREIEHMVVQQPAAQTGAQINQTNNFYSPEPISPGEAARQQRNANRLLLLQMQK